MWNCKLWSLERHWKEYEEGEDYKYKKEKKTKGDIRKKYKNTKEKHTERYNKTTNEGNLKGDSQKCE